MNVRDRVLRAWSNAIAAEGDEVEVIVLLGEAEFHALQQELVTDPGYIADLNLARWELERIEVASGPLVVIGVGVRWTPRGIPCVLVHERGRLLHVEPWPAR